MLDAAHCNGRACYNDNFAKSIGAAINSDNSLLFYNGGLWSKADNSNFLVDDGGASYIDKSVTGIVGIDGNLLYYDNCDVGQKSWSSGYCSSKGMRLPALSETRASNSNGVASCASSTWTSNSGHYEKGSTFYVAWYSTSKADHLSGSQLYIRCVR